MDEHLINALNRIADGIEESNDMLNKIASHYDNIVPVMKRNQVRAEQQMEESERTFAQGIKDIFKPQEN